MNRLSEYREFLLRKSVMAADKGFAVLDAEINPILKPHQRRTVQWLVAGGRRGAFAKFGLGKTVMQIEACRITLLKCGGKRAMITAPLGVRQEFIRDAHTLATGESPHVTDAQREELRAWQAAGPGRVPSMNFIRSIEEAAEPSIYLTNFETIRDGKLDPGQFEVCSLDEASVLRGFGGTKTFREFMRLYESVQYRFVATAIPDPNETIELLAYAAFLGVMDVGQAKTRFFKRNSEKADQLTLHPHKEREFWLWVATWGLFLQKPSDLGFSDEGYALPALDVHWHEVPVDHSVTAVETSGQKAMFRGSVKGVVEASREKRDTLGARVVKMGELLAAEPEEHFLLWHDLEAERAAIEKVLGGSDGEGMVHMAGDVSGQKGMVLLDRSRSGKDICDTERSKGSDRSIRKSNPRISGVQVEGDTAGVKRWASVYGTQDLDEREQAIIDFSDGRIQYLAAKPVIAGSGCNFQRHCAREIFVGIGFKFNDFIQAVHRCYRFLQSRTVVVHIIYAESEREIKADLLRKWAQYDETVANMAEIIRQYGLDHADMMSELARSIGVERTEVVGDRYLVANNDCVEETMSMEADSVDMVLTSIPFSTQYEYTPSYNDFGHTDNNEHFFEQMDFLTPELLRVMKPGRVAAIHVKDRIVPGGMTGLGFQSVYPFHARVIEHFTKHGFAYMGMKTIVTDVVRENNQTYRLGYTEMCKDASKIGVGMPEYLLLFRKPQTDRTKGYADDRVVKERYGAEHSLARWQVKASGFDRSSGDRLLDPEELRQLDHQAIFKLFKHYSLTEVYNFEHHVRIGEALAEQRRLPSDFALLQPASHSPEVWDDITRMQTMNAAQSAKGREMHLCPMQFDIADRAIEQYTNEGDVVYDPFGGLMTTPVRALKLRRRGRAAELNAGYFGDGCTYLRITEMEMSTPTLFDLLAVEEEKECELA
jgi:DNA modification methylase